MTSVFERAVRAALVLAGCVALCACSDRVENAAPPVLEPPSADAEPPPVDPAIVCSEQRSSLVTVHGERFSPVPIDVPGAPALALPSVVLTRARALDGAGVASPEQVIYSGDPSADPSNAVGDDGELIEVDGAPLLQWVSPRELSFRVTQDLIVTAGPEGARERGALPAGVWDVAVRNPDGQLAESLGSLAVVAAPQLDALEPEIVCVEQRARTLVLSGQTFLRDEDGAAVLAIEGVAERLPVELSDCTAIAHDGLDAEACETATVELPQGAVDVGYPRLTLENPGRAACSSEEAVELRVVGAPRAERIVEPLACLAQGERSFVIEGDSFLRLDDSIVPIVTVGELEVAVASMECEAMALPAGSRSVELCTSITFTLEAEALEPGSYDVSVMNPDDLGSGCASTLADALRIAAPPVVEQLEPSYACLADGAREVAIVGSDFLVVDGVPPSVEVGGEALDATAIEASDCDDGELDVGELGVARCSRLVLTLAQGAEPSSRDVIVTNPAPAGCTSDASAALEVLAAPRITAISPDTVCLAQGEVEITLSGSDFVRAGTEQPSVTVGEGSAAVVAIEVAVTEASCTAIPGSADAVRCTELTATLEMSALAADAAHRVTVTNPGNAACGTQDSIELAVVAAPSIAAIDSANVCTGGGTVVISGSGLGGVSGRLIEPDTQGVVEAIHTVVSEDGTSATITFGSGVSPDTYELEITGTYGCGDVAAQSVTAAIGPVAFFMDPPVAYNGVALRGTIYVSGVSAAPVSAILTPQGGGGTVADQRPLTNLAWPVAGSNNELGATIPEGLDEGAYDVTLEFAGACDAVLPGGLRVEADVTLALDAPALEPQFGEQNTAIAVSVLALAEADLDADEVNFEATPRAYLSSAALATAEPLRAVQLVTDQRLTAVVPDTLAAGLYDLVVVNPDGAVGFRAGAYESTAVAPPVIDSVEPTQLDNDTNRSITLRGGNFFNPTTDMAVTLECLAAGATAPTVLGPLAIDGASTATALIATAPSSSLAHGTICIVRATNTTNDTFDELSAITITNPASKLPVFQEGSPLVEGRRAPAIALGTATREARFLYAIGGDDGAASNAKVSVEAAPIGRFGVLGAWRTVATELPAGITQAHAVSGGRYLYLFGGLVTDGATAPTAAIHRAAVLRPEDAPVVDQVDVRFYGGAVDADPLTREGLAPGAFTYVIAAVFDGADTDNPGGESLPSEPLTLYVPDVPDGVEIELSWDPVLGADGVTQADSYRIYRTAAPDGAIGSLALLAEVAAPSNTFIDQNPAAFLDPDASPRTAGDLGEWRELPATLNTPRAAYGLIVANDPSCASYLYVIGGRTDSASQSATYEYASFDAATGALGAFTQATGTGLTARREHAVMVADGASSAFINPAMGACESYVYASSGFSGATSFVTSIQEAPVLAGGALGTFTTALSSGSSAQQFAGHAAFFSSDGAYVMAGAASTGAPPAATNIAQQAELDGSSIPNLDNFSSASNLVLHARYLPGFAREGAFFYLIGGADSSGTALTSTERNVR